VPWSTEDGWCWFEVKAHRFRALPSIRIRSTAGTGAPKNDRGFFRAPHAGTRDRRDRHRLSKHGPAGHEPVPETTTAASDVSASTLATGQNSQEPKPATILRKQHGNCVTKSGEKNAARYTYLRDYVNFPPSLNHSYGLLWQDATPGKGWRGRQILASLPRSPDLGNLRWRTAADATFPRTLYLDNLLVSKCENLLTLMLNLMIQRTGRLSDRGPRQCLRSSGLLPGSQVRI
jgi:hypothetical protein